MPRRSYDDEFLDYDDEDRPRKRSSRRPGDDLETLLSIDRKKPREPRNEADQAFKCGHCKQFIGAPVMGGRQRNHCPNCLYSKHVDHTRPGDRRSTCHSLMEPVGIVHRRNEDVLIHRCLGCGKEDPNRIAADDNPVLLEQLPVLEWGAFSLGSAAVFEKD